jgi:hypothetical protein
MQFRFAKISIAIVALFAAMTNEALARSTGPVFQSISYHITNIWVPDFTGHRVILNQLYRPNTAGNLFDPSPEKVAEVSGYNAFRQDIFPMPRTASGVCNPNSLAILNYDYNGSQSLFGSTLYVACSAPDFILAFSVVPDESATSSTGVTLQQIEPISGIQYSGFNSIVGIAFDAGNNLWIANYGANDLVVVKNAALSQANPSGASIGTVAFPAPPSGNVASPTAIAVDPSDNSFWIVAQVQADGGGLVANFGINELNGAIGGSATPKSCLAALNVPTGSGSNLPPGCASYTQYYSYPNNQNQPLFFQPEGAAVTGNYVWVGNNGGNTPGASIVRVTKPSAGKNFSNNPQVTLFGYGAGGASANFTSKPFACPGGLFAETLKNGFGAFEEGPLWVNDEGFGIPGTSCTATASPTGQVTMFPLSNLIPANAGNLSAWAGGASNVIRTSSPGFGGIFVQDSTTTITWRVFPQQP